MPYPLVIKLANAKAEEGKVGKSERLGYVDRDEGWVRPHQAQKEEDIVFSTRVSGCDLAYVPPVVSNGVRVVKFGSTEVLEETQRWQHALIGCVFGYSPHYKQIENFAFNRWKQYDLSSVIQIKDNLFLFQFDFDVGKDRVLNDGSYSFNSRPFILKAWVPQMKLDLSGIQLGFDRILVDMCIVGDFPDSIILEDDFGAQITQNVNPKQVWKEKVKHPIITTGANPLVTNDVGSVISNTAYEIAAIMVSFAKILAANKGKAVLPTTTSSGSREFGSMPTSKTDVVVSAPLTGSIPVTIPPIGVIGEGSKTFWWTLVYGSNSPVEHVALWFDLVDLALSTSGVVSLSTTIMVSFSPEETIRMLSLLKLLAKELRVLNRVDFSDISARVANCKASLDHLQSNLNHDPLDQDLLDQEQVLATHYRSLKFREGIYFKQKARADWLRLAGWAGKLLSSEQDASLQRSICHDEDKSALMGMGNNKAPMWMNWRLLKQFNSTALAVIPKTPNPSGLTDYRPIDCCTIIYKLITKVLAIRMTQVMPSIIALNQSSFVKGHRIADNILLAHELAHNCYRNNGNPRLTLRNCHFFIVINEGLEGYFHGKGVRQGDPISPLFFVIAMEYLSRCFHHLIPSDFGFHLDVGPIGDLCFAKPLPICVLSLCCRNLLFRLLAGFVRMFFGMAIPIPTLDILLGMMFVYLRRKEAWDFKSLSIWNYAAIDPWLRGVSLIEKFPSICIVDANISKSARVADVWHTNHWRWPDPIDSITAKLGILLLLLLLVPLIQTPFLGSLPLLLYCLACN
ncbi:hypothetical protein ZIOFF_063383 [Zingiber officinale]|uniref:Reverse transcriptase domain-containing protein n=1 Tax=Zingiber officinale TaxID=94328 RepID=A0A8J5KGE0_ZINOF|nr:hypothetical protein ZIOFF_063383 [Zingiber officinale]